MKLISDLIKLSESDLKSSRILYYSGQYPQSVFLFQQSTEKANKAIGLMGEFLKPNQLLGIGHDQVKVYKKGINKQIRLLEELNEKLEPFNEAKNHPLISGFNVSDLPQQLTEGIAAFDELKKSTLTGSDIDGLIDTLCELREFKRELPHDFNEQLIKQIYQVGDWLATFGVAGQQQRLELENWMSLKQNQTELIKILRKILDTATEFGRSISGLALLAIVMNEHSSSPRYPMNGKSPFQLYHANNPLVTRLPVLSEFVEEGISTLKKYQKEWYKTGC
jgi:HEPN domain-containing protein